MAYIRNFRGSSGNRAIISGSNVQVTGSLFGSAISGTTAQFTSLTGTHVAPLGSVSAPSYTFDGDNNTGIYSPTADTIAFVEGGIEAMRIDSSSRVLIGTSTATTSDVNLQITRDRINSAPLLVIDDSNSSSSLDTVFGRLAFRAFGGTQGNSSTRCEVRAAFDDSSGASQLRFMTSQANGGVSTRMILDSSGNLGINTTTATTTQRLTVTEQSSTSTSSYVAEFRNSASTNNAGRFVWSQGSTYALAANVQGTANTAGTTEFQWINRSTGAVISTPLKFDNVSSGDVVLPTGNLVIGTAGNGINFSADAAAAGATSELLNDYEEGTFTPGASATLGEVVFLDTGGAKGHYVKIGKIVNVFIELNISSTTGTTQTVSITGLPFVSYSGTNSHTTTGFARIDSSSTNMILALVTNAANSTTLNLRKKTASSANDAGVTVLDIGSSSVITVNFTYRASI